LTVAALGCSISLSDNVGLPRQSADNRAKKVDGKAGTSEDDKMSALDVFGLKGKCAIVTGGARGIGFAVAELCCAVSADVAIIDILTTEGTESAARLEQQTGRQIRFYHADLTDAVAAAATVDKIEREFGKIDVLINCVGIGPNTALLDISPAEWHAVMNVNVNAQFFTAQAVAKKMVAHRSGSIVASCASGLVLGLPLKKQFKDIPC
jgi:NAD(P)-dependent dehydrogenase (short-subunit alcohol dehydrogenase family)